jgi:NADPH-dependent 2,4-dienoyl-CoA reductase/sulfur reductase-like enzyme/peroxiredoxin family protein/rhodanese-related sulfurtransferase/TusA-related sulfurtransferase
MKVIIVGGVAGGATAAARLRRLDEKAEIILFERGKYISYANCGLPYYIGETIKDRDKILIQTPESFNARFNIDIRVENEVIAIDRNKKEVTVKNHAAGKEYNESYDKLVLSPGAEAMVPPINGINSKRIFRLRTVPDADTIKAFVKEQHPKRAVVVGAGYIGLEMAENLHALGIGVTIIEMAPQVIAPLDFEMAAQVHQHLKAKHVAFYLGEQVTDFYEEDDSIRISLKSGIEVVADMVVLSIGIRPESLLAKAAGLAIGESGGIKVNEYLQTSDKDIYAVGDAVETVDPILKISRLMPLAGPANKQGRIVADNIAGGNTEAYAGTVGTAVAKIFDLAVGVTGYSARLLTAKNIEFASAIVHVGSHAGYYPGAMPLSLKINFSKKDGKVFGAQAVGYKGVDKAIEVLSLMCQFGLPVSALKNMDQAYAPPFSSAKSPVNMIGFVAENILTGKMKTAKWQEVMERNTADTFVLDVRTKDEYALGKISGAYNIPIDELRSRISEVPKDKKIFVYCAVGLRAYVGTRILMQNGYPQVFNLMGGYKTWEYVSMKQSNDISNEGYRIGKNDDMAFSPAAASSKPSIEIDACGMQCPGPIIKLKESMSSAAEGTIATVRATDPGFANDVKSWCRVTGNHLLDVRQDSQGIVAKIQKGTQGAIEESVQATAATDKTIVVFSDSMDRALAAFVIANGALSMGRKVTLFFTFWGLNLLKKQQYPPVRKDIISRMFAFMLPKGVEQLGLSKLNMFGMGPLLMKHIMKKKNIDSLQMLMDKALQNGVEIIACQMSMDVMGIRREELIDGIRIGGVASYIEASESSNMNLFI